MDTNDIFDKTVWPLFTPGMHWALSDPVRFIGRLSQVEDDSISYTIRSFNMPDGDDALYHVNALRDITFNLTDMDDDLRNNVESVTLCMGSSALQSVKVESTSSDVMFSMFSDTSILPLFVFDEEKLNVSVQFKTSITNEMRCCINPKAVHATGLLVKIKDTRKSFFVAGSKDSVLTWDGHQCHVFSKACTPRAFMVNDSFEMPDPLKEAREEIVNSEDSTYMDLWNVLRIRKGSIWNNDSPLSVGLETPR
jgi:hypothetical protein